MPALVSLCVAVALAAAPARPDFSEAELRQLLDGQASVAVAERIHLEHRTGPVHPWRLFMERAPHSRATVDALLALLGTTEDPERRGRLLEALSLEEDSRLRPIWKQMIEEGRPEQAAAWAPFAFEGLLRIGEAEDHRLLMGLLGSDPRLDVWLMRAFGRTGARWASELALRTYRSEQEHEQLRVAAFESALALSDSVPELLTEGLHHRARAIRLAALAHVGVCGDGIPVARLIELADQPDAEIASSALRLLERGCTSEAFRRELVRHVIARPDALLDEPRFLLELGEWADSSGELTDAIALYRRALPALESPSTTADRLRALYRLGSLLQLTGNDAGARHVGEAMKALALSAGNVSLPAMPGEDSRSIQPLEAAGSLLTTTPPGAKAGLTALRSFGLWRMSVGSATDEAVEVTVHDLRICTPARCFDALPGGPATRRLDSGEPIQLHVADRELPGADRCEEAWAVAEVSAGAWRGRLLARCGE